MQCPVCEASNVANARFCHGCGARLTSPLAERCPACGAHAAAGAAFCNECGASLRLSAEAPAPVVEAPPPRPVGEPPGPNAPQPWSWEVAQIWRPIASLPAARSMALIGVGGCAILVASGLWQVVRPHGEDSLRPLLTIAVYAACGFGLWRNVAAGGLVALLLHLGFVLLSLAPLIRMHFHMAPSLLLSAVFYDVIVTAALVCGLRGALAWRRLAHGRATP